MNTRAWVILSVFVIVALGLTLIAPLPGTAYSLRKVEEVDGWVVGPVEDLKQAALLRDGVRRVVLATTPMSFDDARTFCHRVNAVMDLTFHTPDLKELQNTDSLLEELSQARKVKKWFWTRSVSRFNIDYAFAFNPRSNHYQRLNRDQLLTGICLSET